MSEIKPVAWYVFSDTENWVTMDEGEADENHEYGCEVRPLVFGDIQYSSDQKEPNGKLVAWWNGITPGYDGQGDCSIRWGANAENSGHDIPLYDGYNPIHYDKPSGESEIYRLKEERNDGMSEVKRYFFNIHTYEYEEAKDDDEVNPPECVMFQDHQSAIDRLTAERDEARSERNVLADMLKVRTGKLTAERDAAVADAASLRERMLVLEAQRDQFHSEAFKSEKARRKDEKDARRYRYHRMKGLMFTESNQNTFYRISKIGDDADRATDSAMKEQE